LQRTKELAPTSRVMNSVHSASSLQQQPLIVQNTLYSSSLFLEDTWPVKRNNQHSSIWNPLVSLWPRLQMMHLIIYEWHITFPTSYFAVLLLEACSKDLAKGLW